MKLIWERELGPKGHKTDALPWGSPIYCGRWGSSASPQSGRSNKAEVTEQTKTCGSIYNKVWADGALCLLRPACICCSLINMLCKPSESLTLSFWLSLTSLVHAQVPLSVLPRHASQAYQNYFRSWAVRKIIAVQRQASGIVGLAEAKTWTRGTSWPPQGLHLFVSGSNLTE